MESFRVRHVTDEHERLLLLPYTCSVSFITLLHVLDSYLKSQKERTGRTGFTLHILRVTDKDDSVIREKTQSGTLWESVTQIYNAHRYTTLSFRNYLDSMKKSEPNDGVRIVAFERYLDGSLSVAARADLYFLLERLMKISYAIQSNCEYILWPFSTTELARLTLTEIVRGNGDSVSSLTTDGISSYGIKFHHPVRDLFHSELWQFIDNLEMYEYAKMFADTLAIGSNKVAQQSIADVMSQYCTTTEKNYPNIMANVVSTVGKLKPPSSQGNHVVRCRLCMIDTNTYSTSDQCFSEADSCLCRGCVRYKEEFNLRAAYK